MMPICGLTFQVITLGHNNDLLLSLGHHATKLDLEGHLTNTQVLSGQVLCAQKKNAKGQKIPVNPANPPSPPHPARSS